ncbi:MAG: methylated-DNA--[protein]-cysteine S-methyltransferase, partial [Myxococcota bacterium]
DATSITDAIYDAGYPAPGRFYAESDALLGMTPKAFRGGGRGETIRFAVAQGSLGAVLVAATTRGVCAVLLGDDAEALVEDLQARFAEANLEGADPSFDATVAIVVGLVDHPGDAPELPLDLRGTAFQRRVWRALTQIPAGETRTYTEIAAAIGSPRSSRAVAGACAANPVAVIVPCHRVVRADGGLSGYRWGIDRKRTLLQREARDVLRLF